MSSTSMAWHLSVLAPPLGIRVDASFVSVVVFALLPLSGGHLVLTVAGPMTSCGL